MTRWRRPPDSSNEYSSIAPLGPRDADHAQQLDRALARLLLRERRVCRRIASMIWLPTVWKALKRGHRLLEDEPISPPRIARISAPVGVELGEVDGGSPSASPAQPDLAALDLPGRSTMRRIERAVTLLPQPDSPTMPSVRPGCRSKLAPSTARTTPSSWPEVGLAGRAPTRIGSAIGVGRVAQAVAEEVEGEDDDDHRHRRRPAARARVPAPGCSARPAAARPRRSPAAAGRGRGRRARSR